MSEWKSLCFGPAVDVMMSLLVIRCVCYVVAHQGKTEGVISLIADINCTLKGPDPFLSLQLLICQLIMINDDSFC